MYQKGERRREEILRATLRLIGGRGADALTHRAVAEEADVPLSATTYYFASKDELLEQALLLAAREETERLERLVEELSSSSLSTEEWASAVAAQISADVDEDPARHVTLFELALEATRTEVLRADVREWQAAHLRLGETVCRAIGSSEPELDARIVVAALTGLMLEQLASGAEDFGDEVMRPALERLFAGLARSSRGTATAGAPVA
jgi:DNA-binding transcriptional regulator YbjK